MPDSRLSLCLLILLLVLATTSAADAQHELPWTGTGGPCGFPSTRLIRTPSGLLSASGNSIYVSVDSGRSWMERGRVDAPRVTFHGSAVTPSGDILIGGSGANVGTGVLFKSSDDGATWEELPFPGGSAAALATAPDGTIYAGGGDTYNPLRRSTDNGATWEETTLAGVNAANLIVLPDGMIVATGWLDMKSGIYRSTDRGETWSSSTYTDHHYVIVSPLSIGGDTLLASGNAGSGTATINRSTDRGATWNLMVVYPIPVGITTLLAHPSNDTIYAGTSHGRVYRSGDQGVSWHPLGQGLHLGRGVTSLAFVSSNGYLSLIAATPLGPFRLEHIDDSLGMWLSRCNGVSAFIGDLLTISTEGNIFVNTVSGTTHASYDSGATWRLLMTENYGINALAEAPDSSLLIASGGFGLRRLRRDTNNSVVIDSRFTPTGGTAIAVVNGSEIVVGLGRGTVTHSLDNGATWDSIAVKPGLKPAEKPGWVKAIIPAGGDLFVATLNGLFRRASGDSVLMPVRVGSGSQSFSFMASAPGGYLAIAGPDSAWTSSNYGISWQQLPTLSAQSDTLRHVSIAITSNGAVYTVAKGSYGWSGRIMRASADDDAWRGADRAGDPIEATAIALAPDGTLYATSLTEVFRAALSSAVVTDRQHDAALEIPIAIAPNPATDATELRFTLASPGPCAIHLFDHAGRTVLTMDMGSLAAGEHAIAIDVTTLAAGVYPCQITCSGSTMRAVIHVIR